MEGFEFNLWQIIAALISTIATGFFGGGLLIYFLNLKSNRIKEAAFARKEDVAAQADAAQLYKTHMENWEQRYNDAVARSVQKSAEISKLWKDKDKMNMEINMLNAELAGTEIALMELEFYRCNVLSCQRRDPPRSIEAIKREAGRKKVEMIRRFDPIITSELLEKKEDNEEDPEKNITL